MEYVVGKTAGFCFGVKNAVEGAKKKIQEEKNMCCLGEIVHNSEVVKQLESMGMKFIENLDENTEKRDTIIRAHGVSKKIYEEAEQKGINLIDLTCPFVLKIHNIVSEYQQKDYYIFVIGAKEHPETIGTAGFCGSFYDVIQEKEDITKAVTNFKNSDKHKILVVVQTTFKLEKFNDYVEEIKNTVADDSIEIKIENTICLATKERQEETDKISKDVDFMIIIGGKNSSNTKKLYEIAKKNCENTICIETVKELNNESFKAAKRVGIMAGASTPQSSIDEVVKVVENA